MLKEESSSAPPPGWSVRTDKNRADSATHAALLKAARQVFERRGYAHTTIADITSAAHVSRATFYVYFASKAEIFSVIALEVRDHFLEVQEIQGIDLEDPLAVARASIEGFLDAYASNLQFITVLEQQAIVNQAMAELLVQMVGRPVRRTARYIAKVQEQGLANPVGTPFDTANASLGMVAWYAKALNLDPQRHDEYVDTLSLMFMRLVGFEHASLPNSISMNEDSQQ